MSRTAHGLTRVMSPSLCATWERILAESQPSEGQAETWKELKTYLECQE
jgi:hypothetical protein